jgi:stage III sporulation protein AD
MEKVVMIGIMAVLLAIPLKKDKAEFSMLLILTSCLIISALAVWRIRDLLSYLKSLQAYLGNGSIYIKVLFKMIAVTYMAELGANLCRDAGYAAVAGQIEFYGKLMLLAVSLPVLTSLFDVLLRFVPAGM